MPRYTTERVDKLNRLGQQLQRVLKVDLAFGRERGVNAVAHNRQTQRRHVHAKLMALAGDGFTLPRPAAK